MQIPIRKNVPRKLIREEFFQGKIESGFMIDKKTKKISVCEKALMKNKNAEDGFSLVEVIVAMVILLVALLGVFITFSYAVNYNAGNNSRSQALAILQQEVERLRSAKFTPQITDTDLSGGVKAARIVTAVDGYRFKIQTTVDDDPSTPNTVDINNAKTFKQITVTVTLENPTPGWQTSVPATVILRRVRAN